jgi:hypothetical protein
LSASLWVSVKGGGSCHNPNYKGNIFLATSVTKKLDHYNSLKLFTLSFFFKTIKDAMVGE